MDTEEANLAPGEDILQSNPMYGMDDDAFEKQSFTAGIHQNVFLEKVSVDQLETKSYNGPILKFYFADENSHFEHTEFPIDEANSRENAAKWGNNPDLQYAQDLNNQKKRIAHILSCFMTREAIKTLRGNSFEEFANNVVSTLGSSFVNVPVRFKLVLDKKDYCRFPSNTFNAWIQPMSAPNALVINPKYDRIIPLTPDPAAADDPVPDTTITKKSW